jgi:hypothetical protein
MTHAPVQTPAPQFTKAPSNGLATAGMVLGIIGTVLALIPILGIVGAIVGGVGLVLAIFGLLASRKHGVGKGKAIAGLVLGAASILIFVFITAATVAAVDTAVKEFDQEMKDRTDTSAATDISDDDELADATIGQPQIGEFDTVEVEVTLTNNSDSVSDYMATVVFESPDGKHQYGTTPLFVTELEPGQTKVETVMMLESMPGNAKKLSARLTDFDRTPSF